MLEHDVLTAEHTFTPYRSTPGAMPRWVPSVLRPPMMSDTWVPWPSRSIGLGSGASGPSACSPVHLSPTKSNPPFTFGALGPNRAAHGPLGATAFWA